MKKLFMLALPLALLTACSPSPQSVELGTDACDHCQMTIVDEPFAAELVSQKGKVFKFDAIECMVNYLKNKEEDGFAYLLVRDFQDPKDWQDARNCAYLISPELPSPMGGNLTAYNTEAAAKAMQATKGGEVFSWSELKAKLQ